MSYQACLSPGAGLSRVNFNFTARCNMHCPYCYVPFNGRETRLRDWKAIVDRIREFRPLSITFGGGDPFRYGDFVELLRYARDAATFIQVDTNGLNVREATLKEIVGLVELLGLPFDGSSPKMQQLMRGSPSHFNIVYRLLRIAVNLLAVKVNTVVSRLNLAELPALRDMLCSSPPSAWSLYEFWPLADGLLNRDKYEVPHDDFLEAADAIERTTNFTVVEIGTVSDRMDTYFFVRNTGEVYTVAPGDPSRYLTLGSIFDDSTIQAWQQLGRSESMKARIQSRMSLGAQP